MANSAFEIPLQGSTNQAFSIPILGITYNMTLRWNAQDNDNDQEGTWYLDIADVNGTQIVGGIPLITGADLLAQYDYLGFGFQLVVQSDHDTVELPSFGNLGSTSHLYAVIPTS